ncbi:MAG: SDR family oxidoreductase [Novosphingobium sp.]|nr:SDR family oxidoreductase [Novosphingobium sp.]
MTAMDYSGKHVVVTGGATGVGAGLLEVLAELGAPEVTVLDLREPTGTHTTFIETNLSQRDAIDAAVARINGPIAALFNNAGVADTSQRDIVLAVNLLAPIYLTDALLPRIEKGGAVVTTASIAGMAWPQRLPQHLELLAQEGWDAKAKWLDGRDLGTETYSFTKESMQVWTMRDAARLRGHEVRINSVCPSPIDTPLVKDFFETMGDDAMNFSIDTAGRMVTGREVAMLLAYLGSPAATFVSGQNIDIDNGMVASLKTGTASFKKA